MDSTTAYEVVRSNWAIVVAFVSLVWWARQIDLRTKGNAGRLDRHEARLRAQEDSHQSHAVQLARIEEAMTGIKLTLDRIYNEMRDNR